MLKRVIFDKGQRIAILARQSSRHKSTNNKNEKKTNEELSMAAVSFNIWIYTFYLNLLFLWNSRKLLKKVLSLHSGNF